MLASPLTSIVAEHSPEVSNDINDEEDGAFLGLHGQVAPTSVSGDGVICCGLDKQIKNSLGRAQDFASGIRREGEDEDDDEQHHGMYVIREEGCLDTTEHGVDYYTNWEQETGRNSVLGALLRHALKPHISD